MIRNQWANTRDISTAGYVNIIKSILLGSAAGLLAMSAAQAAKLFEYMKICSSAGFYYIPETDTCIRRIPVSEIRRR